MLLTLQKLGVIADISIPRCIKTYFKLHRFLVFAKAPAQPQVWPGDCRRNSPIEEAFDDLPVELWICILPSSPPATGLGQIARWEKIQRRSGQLLWPQTTHQVTHGCQPQRRLHRISWHRNEQWKLLLPWPPWRRWSCWGGPNKKGETRQRMARERKET